VGSEFIAPSPLVGYIQTHCQKNKKIKRADQILHEVYGTTLNSQLQSFQLKSTERLENRLSSKTIKVLLSNRKLTGRKRIVFDSNVHKIAIFSDEFENVKQLDFSLHKFESDNIEFEKKVF
jgi:hypothetical protein